MEMAELEGYRYLAQAGAQNAYGDYHSDAEAIKDFTDRFPNWESISVWDEDFKFWIEIAAR